VEENIMNNDLFKDFSEWLDKVLEENNLDSVIAFNFNLYEGIDEYHIQLIGSDKFDVDDSDWACYEIFTTEENIFRIDSKYTGEEWYGALDFCIKIVTEYLKNGKNKDRLLEKRGAGIGFVDGDLYIIYSNGIIKENIEIKKWSKAGTSHNGTLCEVPLDNFCM
jgi:hypothetical protein